MNFDNLVEEKIKVNNAANIFKWVDDINNVRDAENNGMVFILRLGVFFYFICFVFLFHWLYLLCVKAHLKNVYMKHLSEYAKKHGHDKKYWYQKVEEEIKKKEEEFFRQNKLEQTKLAEKFDDMDN